MELGSNLQIKDLPKLENIEYTDSPDMILASCVGSASGRSGADDDEQEEVSTEDEEAATESDASPEKE
jgi:hypothetical protein